MTGAKYQPPLRIDLHSKDYGILVNISRELMKFQSAKNVENDTLQVGICCDKSITVSQQVYCPLYGMPCKDVTCHKNLLLNSQIVTYSKRLSMRLQENEIFKQGDLFQSVRSRFWLKCLRQLIAIIVKLKLSLSICLKHCNQLKFNLNLNLQLCIILQSSSLISLSILHVLSYSCGFSPYCVWFYDKIFNT